MSDVPQTAPMRVPPHSEEAEKGLLGSILLMPETVLDNCSDRITIAHFFFPTHQTLYSALLRMHEARLKIDIITLGQFLEDDGQLAAVGGRPFITSLYTFVPSAANAEFYIDIIRRKFIRRMIIATCTDLIRQSYEENEDETALLDRAQSEVTGLAMDAARIDSCRDIGPAIDRYIEKLENAHGNRGSAVVEGLATGFVDLDRILSGMKPQQVITIAGITSQGKTAAATNIGQHVVLTQDVGVGIWSMEMSYEEEGDRICSNVADVSLQRLRDGFLSDEDFSEIPRRLSALRDKKHLLYIDDERGMTIAQLSARVRRAVTQKKLGLVIIDHLQFLTSPTKRAQDSRAREISEITFGIKGLAKELRIPIILISHVNREADKRASVFRRPKLADLKESSSIEQDSDVVIFVWRPSKFCENDDDRAKLAKSLRLKNESGEFLFGRELSPDEIAERDRQINEYVEFIVAKQRNGPVGEIRLRFESDITKFQNVTTKSWSNNPNERQSK